MRRHLLLFSLCGIIFPTAFAEQTSSAPAPKSFIGGLADAFSFLSDDALPTILRDNWNLEKLTAALFLVAVATAWRGSRANRQLIERILRQADLAPFPGSSWKPPTVRFFGWSYGEKFHADEKERRYYLVRVTAKERQCLWRQWFSSDYVEIEVGGGLGKGPLSLALVPKIRVKWGRTLLGDLGSATAVPRPQLVPRLPSSFVALSDSSEAPLTMQLENFANIKGFEYLTLSDTLKSSRFEIADDQRVLRVRCTPAAVKEVLEVLSSVLSAGGALLSRREREKLQKIRETHHRKA